LGFSINYNILQKHHICASFYFLHFLVQQSPFSLLDIATMVNTEAARTAVGIIGHYFKPSSLIFHFMFYSFVWVFFFFFSFLNLFLFCRECHLYWLICLPNVNSLSVGIRMRMCLIICIFTFFLT
jgi:hypothetical protein